MERINILVTMPKTAIFYTFFNDDLISKLEEMGNVTWNESDSDHFTKEELRDRLKDIDICVTGWGTPIFDEEVLAGANRLRLIAHTGGSVRPYVTDAAYDKGIRVVSGNRVFAESVAESVIAYALASLRDIPRFSQDLKQGIWPTGYYNQGLLDKKIGIVGYGMISKITIEMLKPFRPQIKVYSRHIAQEELDRNNMQKADLQEIFSTCEIISIHSGNTPENYHLINEELLNLMPEGALLINTARGAIIDEQALISVLGKGKIKAFLDVFEVEPLPAGHGLMELDNAILMPHMGGPTVDRRLIVTKSVLEDMKLFLNGEPMSCEITQTYASKMSTH